MTTTTRNILVDNTFPHAWQAEVLSARPLILPSRHFVYPVDAEEVERGALEILVHPLSRPTEGEEQERSPSAREFLATCALGFRDPAAPSGIWSAPNPLELCAVSGGYAYLINTAAPDRFAMIPYRPVLEVRPIASENLLLFVGHHRILAWGVDGQAWQSPKLSDEGITVTTVDGSNLHGRGWNMMTDKETAFTLDMRTGLIAVV